MLRNIVFGHDILIAGGLIVVSSYMDNLIAEILCMHFSSINFTKFFSPI